MVHQAMPRCVDTDKGAVDFVRPARVSDTGRPSTVEWCHGWIYQDSCRDYRLEYSRMRQRSPIPLLPHVAYGTFVRPCDKSLRYLCLGTFVSTFVCPRHPRAPSCGIRTIYQSIPVTKKENHPGTILLRMALSAGVSASQYAAARGAGYFCFSRPYPPFARRYRIRKVSVSRSM